MGSTAKISTGTSTEVGDTGRGRGIDDEDRQQQLISAALAHWPDLARYASTARIETLTTTLPGNVLARGQVVTVTVFEKGERE